MQDRENHSLQAITTHATPEQYDVAILGGGMAGLTLALELKKGRPDTKIVVIEKSKHPVAETAHKVGESTVEIAAYYLRDVLGLQEHLQSQQLRKFGLRMFFSTEDNLDITHRVEYGQITHAPLPAYQLDRGRLENMLGTELLKQGIAFWDDCKVLQISLQPPADLHHLLILHDEQEQEIQARWVVDASGRSALLKRQLGLAKKVGHHANAVWFRISHSIDIDEWSTDAQWRARISEEGHRSLSTNHLMGAGYWVWLIPLASGSTSIGIVTDANMHNFDEMNRFERALAWLHAHEPQCAAEVEQHQEKMQDFRVMKDYSYSCEQVFSGDRWALVGEAAVAIDPLYSSGGDLIAIGNGLTCDLIQRDLAGEDITDLAVGHSQLFLIFADVWLVAYQQQYPLMSNAKVMVAKVIWDTAVYWAIPGLLYFHDTFRRAVDSPEILMNLLRFSILSEHVQGFLRDWLAIAPQGAMDTFIRYYNFDFMGRLQIGMTAHLSEADLEHQLIQNVHFLERLAGQLVSTVIDLSSQLPTSAVIQSQIQRWQDDQFLQELIRTYQAEEQENPINSGWITLGHQRRERQGVVG